MDHMMHLDQHQQYGDQPDAAMATTGTRSSAGVGVSQVAFVLAAVAFLSLFSSSSFGAATGYSSSSLPSGATLSARQLLAALCGFVTTKKALFVLSNAIFLFLAADCRCFFSGVCGMATPSTNDDIVTASELPPCALQVQPCGSSSGSLYYYCSDTKSASADCSAEQGRREAVHASPLPESAELEGDETNSITLDLEPTCGGVAVEEQLEKLEMDEINRKFEDFIQSRRIKWLKEEEEQVLQCQQQEVV